MRVVGLHSWTGFATSMRSDGKRLRNEHTWFIDSAQGLSGGFDASSNTHLQPQNSWFNLSAVPLLYGAYGGA